MKQTRRRIAGLLTTSMLVMAWGCGSGAPPEDTSTREATVTGTVKIKGKPVTKGDVVFSPGNASRAAPSRKAPLGPDGSYTIKTLVGENGVEIDSVEILKAHLETQSLSYNVKDGENRYDIDLPKAP